MKKAITIIALLVISTLTFAGKPLKVLSGDISFLKEEAVAKVEMDYSQATWEKRSSYETFCLCSVPKVAINSPLESNILVASFSNIF